MLTRKPGLSSKTSRRPPMDEALWFLSAKQRTVREVERHLDECNFGEGEIMGVVERLKELSYLDDAAYASEFIRTRLNTKPVSRAKLKSQLLMHEIQPEVAEEALLAVSEEDELLHAVCAAHKYVKQFMQYEDGERMQRLIQRLAARGFSGEVSRRAAQAACEGE